MDATKTLPVDYLEDKLVTDVDYRQQLLARICKASTRLHLQAVALTRLCTFWYNADRCHLRNAPQLPQHFLQ
eukprot:1149467-Pelagomonas_calceolata.AAC.7